MHIPGSMLHGAICPVTAAVSAMGLTAAVYAASKYQEKTSVLGFAAVTSMVFGLQMLNFPINHATSGHLLGGVLAASLLTTPFAVLSVAVVLVIQAVFFGDGGLNTLGANFINMGLIGAGAGGTILYFLKQKGIKNMMALGIASWLSVVLASAFCSFELASVHGDHFSQILSAMLSVHIFIGAVEALLTVFLVLAIQRLGIVRYANTSIGFAILAAVLSPMSSPLPDGLTSVLDHMRLPVLGPSSFQTMFSGYHFPGLHVSIVSTMAAAAIGVGLTFVLAFAASRSLRH